MFRHSSARFPSNDGDGIDRLRRCRGATSVVLGQVAHRPCPVQKLQFPHRPYSSNCWMVQRLTCRRMASSHLLTPCDRSPRMCSLCCSVRVGRWPGKRPSVCALAWPATDRSLIEFRHHSLKASTTKSCSKASSPAGSLEAASNDGIVLSRRYQRGIGSGCPPAMSRAEAAISTPPLLVQLLDGPATDLQAHGQFPPAHSLRPLPPHVLPLLLGQGRSLAGETALGLRLGLARDRPLPDRVPPPLVEGEYHQKLQFAGRRGHVEVFRQVGLHFRPVQPAGQHCKRRR